MYLELIRISDNGIQTTGDLTLWSNDNVLLATFNTLELSYKDNQRQISCIPLGKYVVKKNISFRFGRGFRIENVIGRDNILIHKGNFNKDTKGCILIGFGLKDLNGDFQLDVKNSQLAMSCLLELLKNECVIIIKSKNS